MFDIGFSEILIIAVVALIVIGPERLPKVARTLGHLFGRAQRYVGEVKADIRREMELEELQKLRGTVEDAARSLERSIHQEVQQTGGELQSAAAALEQSAAAAPPAAQIGGAAAGEAAAPAAAAPAQEKSA